MIMAVCVGQSTDRKDYKMLSNSPQAMQANDAVDLLRRAFAQAGAGALHFVLVGVEDDAYLFVDAVLEAELFDQAGGDLILYLMHVGSAYHLHLDEVLDGPFRQVSDVFAGEDHESRVKNIAWGVQVYTHRAWWKTEQADARACLRQWVCEYDD